MKQIESNMSGFLKNLVEPDAPTPLRDAADAVHNRPVPDDTRQVLHASSGAPTSFRAARRYGIVACKLEADDRAVDAVACMYSVHVAEPFGHAVLLNFIVLTT